MSDQARLVDKEGTRHKIRLTDGNAKEILARLNKDK